MEGKRIQKYERNFGLHLNSYTAQLSTEPLRKGTGWLAEGGFSLSGHRLSSQSTFSTYWHYFNLNALMNTAMASNVGNLNRLFSRSKAQLCFCKSTRESSDLRGRGYRHGCCGCICWVICQVISCLWTWLDHIRVSKKQHDCPFAPCTFWTNLNKMFLFRWSCWCGLSCRTFEPEPHLTKA